MKIIKEFKIYENFIKNFSFRIDTKKQLIELIRQTIRYILSYKELPDKGIVGKITIYVDKMSRIFFFTEKKYFSIVLPFLAQKEKDKLRFSYNGVEIDHSVISKIIRILNNNNFMSENIYTFLEVCFEEFENDTNYWTILRDLILMEDGYIRYDIDEKHLNKEQPKLHPLYHCDIFYTNNNTYKIGTNNPLKENHFIDLLNIKTDCYFIV